MIGITRRSDDSDSDWDSVSENVQQASGDARYALDQRAVLDNTNGNNNDPFKGVKDLPQLDVYGDEEEDQQKEAPLYAEISRPKSDGASSRSAAVAGTRPTSSSTVRGPLTFIDRQLEERPPLHRFPVKTDDMSEACDVPLNVTVDEIEMIMRKLPGAHKIPTSKATARRTSDSSSSFAPSIGFDNIAFEESRGVSPVLPKMPKVSRTEAKAHCSSQSIPLPEPDETIEIYPFDRANTDFYKVSEKRKLPMAERWNDHLMSISNRFWSEIIAVIGVAVICITSLVLQLLRFVTVSVARPLIIGILTGLSDGLIKPLLSTVFNVILQPIAVFLHQIGKAIVTIFTPIIQLVSLVVEPISQLLQSFRLVEIHMYAAAKRPISTV